MAQARNRDTPRDPELLRYLRAELASADLERLLSFATRVGRTLGPGFYAHDLLVEAGSGELDLCETEFKFYPRPFMRRFRGMLDGEGELFSTCGQGAYARRVRPSPPPPLRRRQRDIAKSSA